MSKIEKFHNWAKQFIAIQDSHVKEFLDSNRDMSLYEMKVLFSERYQDRIAFSYVLEIEKRIIRNLHIEKICDDKSVAGIIARDFDSDKKGYDLGGTGSGDGEHSTPDIYSGSSITYSTYCSPEVGDIILFDIVGSINNYNLPVFQNKIMKFYHDGIYKFVLNMTNSPFINSNGLACLVDLALSTHSYNRGTLGIALVNVSAECKNILNHFDLETVLPVFTSCETAVKALSDNTTWII